MQTSMETLHWQEVLITRKEDQVERLVSVHSGAQRLGVSTFTVRRLIKAGELRVVRVGRRVLLPESELERATREGCKFVRREG